MCSAYGPVGGLRVGRPSSSRPDVKVPREVDGVPAAVRGSVPLSGPETCGRRETVTYTQRDSSAREPVQTGEWTSPRVPYGCHSRQTTVVRALDLLK